MPCAFPASLNTAGEDTEALHNALNTTDTRFVDATEAANIYTKLCEAGHLNANNTFLKQLLSGTTVFEFDNGYLGENGIGPIMETLAHTPIRELILSRCVLTAEDVKVICTAFNAHSTLERIDFRGNIISLTSAKLILTLVSRTPSITELDLDIDTPKYVAIKQQCIRNGNAGVSVSLCVCCERPVVLNPGMAVELNVIQSIMENCNLKTDGISEAVFELTFRFLRRCCEAGHGVLFLCGGDCAKQLGADISSCTRAVVKACHHDSVHSLPRVKVLREYTETLIREFTTRQLPQSAYKNWTEMSATTASAKVDKYEQYLQEEEHSVPSQVCAICGTSFQGGIQHVPLALMTQLQRDISRGAMCSPSGYLRLCHNMIDNATLKACCSRRCIRQIERYAVYGYCGVVRVFSAMLPPLSTVIDREELREVPTATFSIVNFEQVVVDSVGEEDLTCALTVASAMEDIDGVPIDPYMIYAVGRHLSNQPISSLGMELKSACEAVRLTGCLAVSDAPFRRREGLLPCRRDVAEWSRWGALGNVEKMLSCAFARRRQGVYTVDGPHKNLSENVRAALWQFRHQRRSVLVAVKFCAKWLSLKDGIIDADSDAKGGFYTTVKVIGQTLLHNTYYLILQSNFGYHAGYKGFFYMSMNAFNRHVYGSAYIFADPTVVAVTIGNQMDLVCQQLVSPMLRTLSQSIRNLSNFVFLLKCAQRLQFLTTEQNNALENGLRRMPLGMFTSLYYHDSLPLPTRHNNNRMRHIEMLLHSENAPSQILFIFSEVLGEDACHWLHYIIQLFSSGVLPTWAASVLKYYEQVLDPLHPAIRGSTRMIDVSGDSWITPRVSQALQRTVPVRTVPEPPKQERRTAKRHKKPHSALNKQSPVDDEELGPASSLMELWKEERAEMQIAMDPDRSKRLAAQLADSNSCSSILLKRMTVDGWAREETRSVAAEDTVPMETVAYQCIGESWCAIHLTTDGGEVSSTVALFITDSVCLYDLATQSLVHPLTTLASDMLFFALPFTNGIDCAFNHPTHPRHAYIFSGDHGLIWDTLRMEVIQGPYTLRTNETFKRLPGVFWESSITSAVPVPGTAFVLLFSQLHYIVYDLAKGRPASALRLLKGKGSEVEVISSPLPKGMAALALEMRRAMEVRRGKALEEVPSVSEEVLPDLPEGFSKWFSCGPMTCLWERATLGQGTSILLIGFGGHTASVQLMMPQPRKTADKESQLPMIPLTQTYLKNIPMPLRQMCTDCIQPICAAIAAHHLSVESSITLSKIYEPELNRREAKAGEVPAPGFPTVRSSLVPTKIASQNPSLLMCPGALYGEKCTGLFRDEVLYHSAPPKYDTLSASDSRQDPIFIECDMGSNNCEAFGAVVILLDCADLHPSILRLAPVEAYVESSDDGIAFQIHSTVRIDKSVSSVSWPMAHAARFWRVRFHTPVPHEVGFLRILWYQSDWSLLSNTFSALAAPLQMDSCRAQIEAGTVLSRPESILHNTGLSAVFAAPSSKGWYERHCVLPLLGLGGNSCLFFCGDSFLEYNMDSHEVAGNRSVRLGAHPAFSKLPHPFNLGLDAVFYPDSVEQPTVVAMVRDGSLILWNLKTGTQIGEIYRCSESIFRGMPIGIESICDVVNVWGTRDELLVIVREGSDVKVIHWNMATKQLIGKLHHLRSVESLSYAALDDEVPLCVFSMPSAPSRFFVFAADGVGTPDATRTVSKVSLSREFYRVCKYLTTWGRCRHDCVITVDLRSDAMLALGIEMRSSRGDSREWLVEYSDDGLLWKKVASHFQTTRHQRTTWKPAHVEKVSHRFWRFRCAAKEVQLLGEQVTFYSQIRLLTLPMCLHRSTPEHFASSGTLTADLEALFSDDTSSITFEGPPDRSVRSHHLTLDYSIAPVEMAGFSCASDKASADVWSVYCSLDGSTWALCGSFRANLPIVKGMWMPEWVAPFWRFELSTTRAKATYRGFSIFTHKGPSVVLNQACRTHSFHTLLATSVLWPHVNTEELSVESDCIRFEATVGNTITIDTKSTPVALLGIDFYVKQFTSNRVEFLVEYSADCVRWYYAEFLSLCAKQHMASAYWPLLGRHRFWRMRVIRNSNCERTMFIEHLRLTETNFNLYQGYTSDISAASRKDTGDECIYLRLPVSRSIVRMKTMLPPNSCYAIERLSLDGVNWEMIATVDNHDLASAADVVKAWPRSCPSASWRLRYLRPVSREVELSDRETKLQWYPVQWFAFSTERPTVVEVNSVKDLMVTCGGFEEEKLALDLTLPGGCPSNAALTSTPAARMIGHPATGQMRPHDATVMWTFPMGICFDQVYVKTRFLTTDAAASASSTQMGQVLCVSTTGYENTRSMSKSTPAEAEDEEKPILLSPLPTIVVETSFNGKDFVAVAEAAMVASEGVATLSWHTDVRCPYWQIRLQGLSPTVIGELCHVQWFVLQSVSNSIKVADDIPMSNTLYSTWMKATYNNEDAFMTSCRLGLDQSKSRATKLRAEDDVDPIGERATSIVAMQKKYKSFIIRLAKKAQKGSVIAPPGLLYSQGAGLATDLMFLIKATADKYKSAANSLEYLLTVVNHPMNLGKTLTYAKKDSLWFYPRFSVYGKLAEDFYGFSELSACYSVYWSLSHDIQRDADLLADPAFVDAMCPHIASPVVAACIGPHKWSPAAHFPAMPFLDHVGFGTSGSATIIAFAVNEVLFTKRYPLQIGEGDEKRSLPFTLPYRLFSGVNFLQHVSLTMCPAPVFDVLRRLYDPTLLAHYRATVVLTAPTTQKQSCQVRFRLPTWGQTLGFDSVTFESFEFEIDMLCEQAPPPGSRPVTPGQDAAPPVFRPHYLMSFVSHGGQYPLNQPLPKSLVSAEETKSENPPAPCIPFSLVGTLSTSSPAIPIQLYSPSGNLPFPSIPQAYITAITVRGVLIPKSEPPLSYHCPKLTLSGQLVLSGGVHYPCSYHMIDPIAWEACDEMEVSLLDVSLLNLMSFAYWITHNAHLAEDEEVAWLRTLPVRLSVTLVVSMSRRNILGSGAVRLYDHLSDRAVIAVDKNGFNISGTLAKLSVGQVTLNTSPHGEPVQFNIGTSVPKADSATQRCGVLFFMEGFSSIVSQNVSIPLQLVVSHEGVVCLGTTNAFDISLEDRSIFPYFTRAQVVLRRDLFYRAITIELEKTPIVTALRAHGLPFIFSPQELTVEPFLLRERRLNLTLRGVLFGCWFEVSRGFNDLAKSTELVRSIAAPLATLIIEQCEGTLWSSYANVVGCITTDKKCSSEAAAVNWHFMQKHGRFLSKWVSEECTVLDEELYGEGFNHREVP